MRLWHYRMIPNLDRQRLLGQHRECCALRGKGWGRKHSTVDYVFRHSRDYLVSYHFLVMTEMEKRGYHVAKEWLDPAYRGRLEEKDDTISFVNGLTYPEHNDSYYQECVANLASKGVDVRGF